MNRLALFASLIVGMGIGYFFGWTDYKRQDPWKLKCLVCQDELRGTYRLNGALTDMVVECERKLIKKKRITAFQLQVLPELENGGLSINPDNGNSLEPTQKKTTTRAPILQEDLIDQKRVLSTGEGVVCPERTVSGWTSYVIQRDQETRMVPGRTEN